MAEIEISVVIPTHNRGDLLKDLLLALSEQTFPMEKFEAVVVADGSTDGTQGMLKSLSVPYELKLVDQPQSGVATARNNGARAAQGEIIVFLDDDVVPDPSLLKEYSITQTSNPQGVVLGLMVPSDEGDRNGWNTYEDFQLRKHYSAVADGTRPPAGRRLYSGNFSIPRDIFLKHNGFDETFGRGEDVELGFRLEQDKVPFYYNANASAVHRGYRSFDSWCSSAKSYGHCEVTLALKRNNHNRALAEIAQRYYARPTLVRRIIEISMGRNSVRGALIQTLKFTSGIFSKIGLYKLVHPGYSIIFNMHYWHGIADELGGKEAFNRYVCVSPKSKGSVNVKVSQPKN